MDESMKQEMDENTKNLIIEMYLSYKKYKEELKKILNKRYESQRKYVPEMKDIDKIMAIHFDEDLYVLLLKLLKRLEFKKDQLQPDLNAHVEKMLAAMPKKTDDDIDEFERLMDKYFNDQIKVGGSITKKNRKSKKSKKRRGTKKRR